MLSVYTVTCWSVKWACAELQIMNLFFLSFLNLVMIIFNTALQLVLFAISIIVASTMWNCDSDT